MRTIAIILGDNDFDNTFRPLLEGIARILKWREPEQLPPNVIELIIRESTFGHYLAYQHRFDLESSYCHDSMVSLRDYFDTVLILFDEEAEADIAESDHDHGAWYLDVQSGLVFSY